MMLCVGIIHEAKMQWLKQYNYTELNIEGIGLIMSDLAVEFKNESFYGDVVEVAISAGEITRVRFELFYLVQTNRNDETILIANAKTGMVVMIMQNKKVATIPEGLKRCNGLEV